MSTVNYDSGYYQKVRKGNWGWGILSPGMYGQLGLDDTIIRCVRSVWTEGYNHQVSTISRGWGYTQQVSTVS